MYSELKLQPEEDWQSLIEEFVVIEACVARDSRHFHSLMLLH